MAVVVQSSQTATGNTGTPLTITKPTSTAVGDLLIAVIGSGNTVPAAPSGWTLLTSQTHNSGELGIYYVIATATEVAATDFTWATSSNTNAGGILRITGQQGTPVAVFAKDAQIATSTPSFGMSVTPQTTNSLLLFCVSMGNNATAVVNISNYAVTTSDPTWTEQFDVGIVFGGGGNTSTAVAYATRPQITATGNATCVFGNTRNTAGVMVVVRPLIINTTVDTVTLVETFVKKFFKIISDITILIETVTNTKLRLWRTVTKPITIWRNKNK